MAAAAEFPPRDPHERRWPVLLWVCAAHAAGLAWLAAGRAAAPAPVTPPIVTGRLVAEMPAAAPHRPTAKPRVSSPVSRPTPRQRAAPGQRATERLMTPLSPAAAPADAPRANAPTAMEEAPVTPPVNKADGLDNPKPVYPALSKRLGEEGVVLVSLLILADGQVTEVALARTSGYPRLDAAALAAVRHWHYRPARRGGVAIDYRYLQPVAFSINDE